MAEPEAVEIEGLTYLVPAEVPARKAKPALLVVINGGCTACSGSPLCKTQCPVDCIHFVCAEGRPVRVWVDGDVCIGCLNCFSYEIRPRHLRRPDLPSSCAALNATDVFAKAAVCPWDAIEVLPFELGVSRSAQFYPQPHRNGRP